MSTILITGANRGLGLELTSQYAAAGAHVHACCRDPEAATALRDLAEAFPGKVTLHRLEVTDDDQRRALADALGDAAIDVLIHNAGVYLDKGMGFGNMDEATWLRSFQINTLAPLKLTEALIEHVARSKRKVVAIVTSLMGSVADNEMGGFYAYRSSKAAVNMVGKSMAVDLAPRGVTCVLLHPGWVQTDMGGANAPLDAPTSCAGMRAVLDKLTAADTGRFLRWDGATCPW